jgi:hypothetical protein
VNLGELLNSSIEKYTETSCEKQGSGDDSEVVGLVRTTQRMGKPFTRGRDQQRCTNFRGDL